MSVTVNGQSYDTMNEVCERLQISRSTLLKYFSEDKLPHPPRIQKGRMQIRYFPEEWYEEAEKALLDASLDNEDLLAEEIGRVGEGLFEQLFSKRQVAINKSSQDLRGWDYMVEFKPDLNERSYDSSQKHKKFFVQVKTVLESTRVVSGKLSSIEMVARNELPSGILVLKIDQDEQLKEVRYIEFIDEALEHVLKALRTASLDRKSRLNKVSVSFSIKKFGKQIDHTMPGCVSNYLNGLFDDQKKYVDNKSLQCEQAGFQAIKFHFSIQPNQDNFVEELSKISLGEKSFTPSSLSVLKKRFDIELPHPDFEGVDPHEFSIRFGDSESPMKVAIRAVSQKLKMSVDVWGAIHKPVFGRTADGYMPFKFETKTFKILVLGLESGKSEFESFIYDADNSFSAEEFRTYFLFLLLINQDDCELSLVLENGTILDGLQFDGIKNKYSGQKMFDFYSCADAIEQILYKAGIKGKTFTFDGFQSEYENRELFLRYTNSVFGGEVTYTSEKPLPEADITKGCFIDLVKIADNWLAIKTIYPEIITDSNSIRLQLSSCFIEKCILLGNSKEITGDVKDRYETFANGERPDGRDMFVGILNLD